MLCRIVTVSSRKKIGVVPVYLNVYDLTPINGYAYWLGLGVYHSGVQGEQRFRFFLAFWSVCFLKKVTPKVESWIIIVLLLNSMNLR